jgi:hypothetical protein
MNKMTLQDAHKTGRRYREMGSTNSYFRFSDNATFPMDVVMAEYEVEPEVFEVECEMVDRQGFLSIGEMFKPSQQGIYNKLVGKHVKATFEVLD